MTQVKINAGICGFLVTVNATSNDGQYSDIKIISECPNYKHLENEIIQVDAFEECFGKIGEGNVYNSFKKHCPHGACPVPCGVIKAVEVSCGLALPKNVVIEIANLPELG